MEYENNYGLIYGLTNPYFNGMVKIGATRSLDINKRMRTLGTAVPAPFVCAFAYKVPHDYLFNVEHILHDTFEDKRIKGSEFFQVEPQKIDKLLLTLGNFEPMKSAVQEAIDTATEDEEKKIEKHRNPNMDFVAMGLHEGDTLFFKNDHSKTCTIVSNKRVLYNGKEVSLSSFTHQLLGYKRQVQPSQYWVTESGVSLAALYIDFVSSNADRLKENCETLKSMCHEKPATT